MNSIYPHVKQRISIGLITVVVILPILYYTIFKRRGCRRHPIFKLQRFFHMGDFEIGCDVANCDDEFDFCSDNPQVPVHRQKLSPRISVGSQISILGKTRQKCLRFAINLLSMKSTTVNIALHFNPRLDQRYVIRNSRFDGEWGVEETTSSVKFEIDQDKDFEVDIFTAQSQFFIAVNGRHFCAYTFRVPIQQITDLEVTGHVDVKKVKFVSLQAYPEEKGDFYFIDRIPLNESVLVNDVAMDLPYIGKMQCPFTDCSELEIHARVKIMPYSFFVNLQNGHSVWPHPVIPLHLNPRFSGAVGSNSFIRNSWFGGSWSSEERSPSFPFSPGEAFKMLIRKESAQIFSVWINDKLCVDYLCNLSLSFIELIDTVVIQGDIHLFKVEMRSPVHERHGVTISNRVDTYTY